MFGVGFSEMLVIAVVGLVVIGPERMPGVARTAGALFGRAQRYINKLKAEIESEVDLEEIKRIKATFYDAAKSVEHSVSQVKQDFDATAKSLNASIAAPSETPVAAAVEAQHVPAQMDLWLDSAPAAAPAAATRT
jgi:sec-independent protein translocase protein TatB